MKFKDVNGAFSNGLHALADGFYNEVFLTRPFQYRPKKNKSRFVFCLVAAFALALCARLLELPFWDNPAYSLNGEHILATHDAYHWVAGAEGFEFGAGHPMSELLRLLCVLTGLSPARLAFWLPPFMSGLLSVAVFLWCWGLGRPYAGLCAGLLTSLSPVYCARTMLGFYDSDLVTLLFAVLIGLVPALWLAPWLRSPLGLLYAALRRKMPVARAEKSPEAGGGASAEAYTVDCGLPADAANGVACERGPCLEDRLWKSLSPTWTIPLLLSGLFAHWAQEWHSLFPYLTRYFLILPPLALLLLGRAGARRHLLAGGLCHALPLALGGWPGLLAGGAWLVFLALARHRHGADQARLWDGRGRAAFLAGLWAATLVLAWDASVPQAMWESFASYTQRGADTSSLATSTVDPLLFPAVAQSIIEVQTIAPRELLLYTYPYIAVACAAVVCAALFLAFCPAFAWLAPLAGLWLLSLTMGARMTMFGPAVLFPALCMGGGCLLEWAAGNIWRAWSQRHRLRAMEAADAPQSMGGADALRGEDKAGRPPEALKALFCLFVTLSLAWPLARFIPDYTQGPIMSREQAQALTWLGKYSAPEAMVWNWWDWGYATHHFAHRHSIADGARHGGPSLYLPAAVYSTANPRFARQIIKHTALHDNVPGRVFAGMTSTMAHELMRELGDDQKALIRAPGRQYLVVSLELLRLGLWVTRYGSWNFSLGQGSGAIMNNLTPALRYNIDSGVIMAEGSEPVYAADIVAFAGNRLEHYNYKRSGAFHFIFNLQSPAQGKEASGPAASFWRFVRGPDCLSFAVTDKMAMDTTFFNSMMVQLLIRDPQDPFIAPYFKLVFDNVHTRVYEVL